MKNQSKEFTLGDISNFIVIFKPVLLKCFFVTFLFALLFTSLGYIAKKTSPKEYESVCVLYDEQGAYQNNSIMVISKLAGDNLNNGLSESSGGDLYQLILKNKPFLLELAKIQKFKDQNNKNVTLEQYFKKDIPLDAIEKVIIGIKNLPQYIKSLISSASVNVDQKSKSDESSRGFEEGSFINKVYVSELTANDKRIIGILGSRIRLTQSGKLSTLSVKMPDPKLSASVNKTVFELLIKYAIRFKVSKQIENVNFLEARTKEAEVNYKVSQKRVANFKDNNYNVVFQGVLTEESVLQNNFVLYSAIYNQLSSQLEQAKIQLKKDSPLFTVVEPIYIPDQVAIDNSKVISYLIKGVIIGFFVSTIILYLRYKAYKKIKINI